MLTATLFIKVKNWKQFKCLASGDWIKKIQYIQTMRYCSVIKGDKLLIHATTSKNRHQKYYANCKKPDIKDI